MLRPIVESADAADLDALSADLLGSRTQPAVATGGRLRRMLDAILRIGIGALLI